MIKIKNQKFFLIFSILLLSLSPQIVKAFTLNSEVIIHLGNSIITLEQPIEFDYFEIDGNRLYFTSSSYLETENVSIILEEFNPASATASFTSNGTDTIYSLTWTDVDAPYLTALEGNITSLDLSSYVPESKTLAFTVGGIAATTTTAQVYCGALGSPSSVSGGTFSYNAGTQTATISGVHSSSIAFTVYWTSSVPVGGPGNYTWNPFDLMNTYLKNQNFVGFLVAIYTSIMGELFYGMLILIITIPLYLRTQSLIYCAIVWLVLGSFFAAILPVSASHIAYFFIAISLTSILYKLLTREKD
jgi:hypothetical protein